MLNDYFHSLSNLILLILHRHLLHFLKVILSFLYFYFLMQNESGNFFRRLPMYLKDYIHNWLWLLILLEQLQILSHFFYNNLIINYLNLNSYFFILLLHLFFIILIYSFFFFGKF